MLKKISGQIMIITAALVLFFALLTPALTDAASLKYQYTAYTLSTAPYHRSASGKSRILGHISKHKNVSVYKYSKSWYTVKYANHYVYIYKKYLKKGKYVAPRSSAQTLSVQTISVSQNWSKLRIVNNSRYYDVKLGKKGDSGRKIYGRMNVALNKVKIKTYKTSGARYTFRTYAWLPFLDKHYKSSISSPIKDGQLTNPQSFVVLGGNLYTTWSTFTNQGYITKFPMKLPSGMARKNEDFRSAYWYKYVDPNKSKKYAGYVRNGYRAAGADSFFNTMRISGPKTIGHGQTLSTDGQSLYMLQDTDFAHSNLKGTGKYITLVRYDKNMNMNKQWKFRLRNSATKNEYNPHTLAMIDGSHFYLGLPGSLSGGYKASYVILKGTISGSKVSVKPAFRVKYPIGKYFQGLTYNKKNHRLYISSDNTFVGIDVRNYKSYSSKIPVSMNTRETEGMAFDGSYGYMLFNSYPELIRTKF
ncbi:hypothetical protein [Sporolactobacillus vineae]|uniref:hypothetical protein n=1 Tax=Sporolactobacillus vineae TaxID=444463 RepID=UPI00031A0C8F|nr:hypothetical protein [Sporolactobacillus vineae]